MALNMGYMNMSTMMNKETKERAREIMKVDYISSEESTTSSGDDLEEGSGRKLVCRPLRTLEIRGGHRIDESTR